MDLCEFTGLTIYLTAEAAVTAIVLLLWVGGPIFNAAPILEFLELSNWNPLWLLAVWLRDFYRISVDSEFQALMYLFFFLAHGLLHEPSARGIPGGEPVPIWVHSIGLYGLHRWRRLATCRERRKTELECLGDWRMEWTWIECKGYCVVLSNTSNSRTRCFSNSAFVVFHVETL